MTKEHSEEKVKDVKIKLKSDYGNDESVIENVFIPMVILHRLYEKYISEKMANMNEKDESHE